MMPASEEPLLVVGICGSLRKNGYTAKALAIALRGAEELGAQTRLVYLGDYDLVFCDGRNRDEYPDDVHRLRDEVRRAQGIILGTPEYHGGVSGVLKNALDLMGFDEFEGKMLGLIGVAGGKLGALNALNSLRVVGRSLHAWVVPDQVSIPEAWKAFDEQGNLIDDKMQGYLENLGRQVARFAYLHTSRQTQEFLHLWERAVENPGAES